jgi:hypothetical protein
MKRCKILDKTQKNGGHQHQILNNVLFKLLLLLLLLLSLPG